MPAGSQATVQSSPQKTPDFELCWDKQQHDTSLQTKKKKITQGNSIKL